MDFLSLSLLVPFSLLLLSLLCASARNPGFTNYPLLGTLPSFVLNRHRFLDWTTSVLLLSPSNTALFRRPGNIRGLLTASPANVQHMLKTNFKNYPKGPRFLALLQDFLGQGIFNSDGEGWMVQRKVASYEFNTRSLRAFGMEVAAGEVRGRLMPVLARVAESGRVMDMQDVLERFAFDNICKVAFNVDPGCLGGDGTAGSEFMQAFEEAATLSSQRFMQVIPSLHLIKKYFNIGSEKRLRKSISIVHQFADKIIKSRMEERAEKRDEDLLSRFIGSESSVEFLRDIIISFILAGRDTTSSALSWFFWQLASAPDVEKKILEELQSIRTRNGKSVGDTYSFDELREMTYLHAAISESMRLYPPVPVDTKACLEDDVMPDGTFVGKGYFVSYCTYSMGRMVNIWGEDCCEFRPERWIDDADLACRQVSTYKYPVFHAGPRICLGKDMAYIQMKSIVASVLERFVIDVQDKDTCPEHVLSLTLRMKGGLPVKVRERSLISEEK